MKRDGHIIEEIVTQSNLEESFDTVLRGTLRKKLSEGKWLLKHRAEFLQSVRDEIMSGKLNLSGFHAKDIVEGGKLRHIQVFNMRDRIKVNAVMSVVDKHLRNRYIRTTSASIKQRGMHELKDYIVRDMSEDPTLKYWYKFDIKKFYDTVHQDFAMYALRRVFKDEKLLKILEQFVYLLPGGIGMSMGLRASQGICNLLLSVFLDHYLKDRYGIKHYYRYCDDGLVGASDKRFLWACRDVIHEKISVIKQTIKGNERVFPIENGLDFLGYVIYPTHVKLRKRVKKSFARKLVRYKSRKKREVLVGSFYGMACHADCRNLMRKLLFPSEMKKFSELGISYLPTDGKKRFPNRATQLRQLVNVEIEVMDFERDVNTKFGKRWLVMYRDTRTNETSKFFTDCDEMKQSLERAEQMSEIPFSTVIGVEYFGDNKSKFKFT